MKVALITERTDINLGGAERSVAELAQALGETGIHVETLASAGKPTNENTRILCAERTKRPALSEFRAALQQHLQRTHYDIIHSVLPFDFADVYQPRGGAYAEAIIRNAASYPHPLLQRFKRVTAWANPRRTQLLKAEKKLCKSQSETTVAALSDYVAQQFKQHYNLAENRIVIIRNGIRKPTPPNPEKIHQIRQKLCEQCGVRPQKKSVLFFFAANNFRLKGLAPLIKALSRFLGSRDGPRVCLLAAGSSNSRPYRRLAAKLGIAQNFAFIPAPVDVYSVLSATDVAVLPTFYDPSSRFTLEALALYKPVITTAFNGAADFIVEGRHGKIIDSPNDITTLADALSHFSVVPNIENASHAIAEDNLPQRVSISRVARQLLDLYKVLPRRSRSQGLA